MEPPEKFPFPFSPYKIQDEFMRQLYVCLENGSLGIFESPTGTGKSLSIICGALKWLLDHESQQKNELETRISELEEQIKRFSKSTENWFVVQTEQIQLTGEKQALQSKLDAIQKFENKKKSFKDLLEKENSLKKMYKAKYFAAKQKKESNDSTVAEETDTKDQDIEEKLVLEDIVSDSSGSEDEDKEELAFQNTKIFFCSRTHSQLSQFVGELKRSPYSQDVSSVVLASRQNYCINEAVKKLKHVSLINEQCLQLQRRKTTVKKEKDVKRSKTASGCPFLPGSQQLLIADLLTDIQDIEETVQKGQMFNTCAYYATRKSVEDAQLVLVPYNSILHKDTRVSSGINIKGNILIIDEAHNLLDAIERMHSASVTGRNLLHCYSQLSQYQKRFQALFSAKNVLYLSQLSFCLKKLLTVFGATTKSQPGDKTNSELSPKLYKIEEFEVMTEIDTVNMFELLNFVKSSKLIHKLQGFVEQYGNTVKVHENAHKKSGITQFLSSIRIKDDTPEKDSTVPEAKTEEEQSNNPLMSILSFLECLKSNCADGRIFVTPGSTVGQGTMKFLLLNPAAHFHDIVRDARAVILAGGTMEPMSEFTDQLFLAAGADPNRIITFSCDHVIPEENIMSHVVTRGPTGVELEFNFQNRDNTKLLDELGRTLVNLCNIVPAGIVVFLPSYNYEEIVYKHLDKTGILSKLSAKKRIFREPKLTSQVNNVLEQYAVCTKSPQPPQNGSLLFSVVNGKLSEGLNFSDDLGRCVVVVGMPYPNVKSPELQEKMKYLNENVKSDAGQSFYENSCMKAVNQCIGRAVRHINDYSTVVLLDKRYGNKTKALPRWIQRTLKVNTSFGSVIGSIAKFFAAKRKLSI